MSKQVNVGFIGVGGFVSGQHLPNAAGDPRLCVHTLCDLNEKVLKDRADEYHPEKTTTDYHTVLNDPDVELVIIGTRGDLHAKLACETADAGKDILVEKPMTHTSKEAALVVEAVRRNKVRLLVGFNRRFSPAMQKAKEIYHSASDGAPGQVYYRMAQETKAHYAFDLSDGGGHLVTEGCHILDVLPWFLEEEPVEVYAVGEAASNDNVTIRFSGGSIATILLSAKASLCYPKELMEVFSGYRTLVMQQYVELQTDNYPNVPHKIFFKMRNDCVSEVPGVVGVDGGIELYAEKLAYLSDHDLYWERPLPVDKGHRQMLYAYSDAILTDKPSPIDEVAGARATVCALAALESIRRKTPIEIQPADYFSNPGKS